MRIVWIYNHVSHPKNRYSTLTSHWFLIPTYFPELKHIRVNCSFPQPRIPHTSSTTINSHSHETLSLKQDAAIIDPVIKFCLLPYLVRIHQWGREYSWRQPNDKVQPFTSTNSVRRWFPFFPYTHSLIPKDIF